MRPASESSWPNESVALTGFDLAEAPYDGQSTIRNAVLLTTKNAPAALGPEGYMLDAAAGGVTIAASDGPGLFYGTQTLLQLLPPQIFLPAKVAGKQRG